MKWYDSSYNNTNIEKIPYRLLRINDDIYDSIFERGGEYFLSVKCGVTTYYKNHDYENFIHDGYKMIYELPAKDQKEIKLENFNVQNFLQENKTIISSIPGSEISLDADINVEYVARRELSIATMLKYDDDSFKDFPMDTRNYDEDIVIERLINNTKETKGYQKNNEYYFDIKENREYLKVIENGNINNKSIETNNNSIILPSSLASSISWNTEQGTDVVIENTAEGEQLTLIEIWGDTYQDTSDLSNIQHIGKLYTDNKGRSVLNKNGNEQYIVEIESKNYKNLIDTNPTSWKQVQTGSNLNVILKKPIKVVPNSEYIFIKDLHTWGYVFQCNANGDIIKQLVGNNTDSTKFMTPSNCEYVISRADLCSGNAEYPHNRKFRLFKGNTDLGYDGYINNRNQAKTTILLPCQLMKVGNVADKLYWDEKNNKYIIEKNINLKEINKNNLPPFYFLEANRVDGFTVFPVQTVDLGFKNGDTISDSNMPLCNKFTYVKNGYAGKIKGEWISTNAGIYTIFQINNDSLTSSDRNGFLNWLGNESILIYYKQKTSQLIETTILEQKTLNSYNDRTYVTISNTNLSPIIKVKAPIDTNTSNQISLPRENNFDSILNVTLEPNNNTNITFFEGGLDLEITKGKEIQDNDGNYFNSDQPNQYASNDYIDLISYTTSTFTIDTFDISIQNMKIYYYNQDKRYLSKIDIAFKSGEFHKSGIKPPNNTKYCKVAFSTNDSIEYSKIRILRDKTKEYGFKTIAKTFNNDKNYTESFSELISIKDDIERLVVYSNNYPSINNFDIINNFDKNQKTYSCKIPKLLEPGETLSYTKVGKKQFLYKTDSTPYNSITNVNYSRPYKEYDNIVDSIEFTLFKALQDNNGDFVNTSDPYCATEKYADVADHQGKTITLSVASLMTKCAIVFYNQQKGFIKRFAADANYISAVVPDNAYYMRFACYLNTLAAQTPETQELIQKHVMVTLTSFRCDFVPYGVKHSCTIIPEEIKGNKYELSLNNDDKYLFVEPYKFNYKIKDMNSINASGVTNSGKWSLDFFSKEGINGYATLDAIKNKAPFESTLVERPTWVMYNKPYTLMAFTKYIQTSAAFTLAVKMSIDDFGSIYLNDKLIINYSYGENKPVELPLKEGVNKLVILIVNDGGSGGVTVSPEITTSSHNNIVSVGDQCDYDIIDIKDKFTVDKFFAHNIVDGNLLTPKENNLKLRIDSSSNDKFIFAKDFAHNPDKKYDGYINANAIKEEPNSRTYINRVYGKETNLTLLTVGGNICEIYFLNDYLIESNSHYTLYAKYTSGNQKVKIDKIPDNARYIVVVTDKENEGDKCSNIFLFPGEITRNIDTTSKKFEIYDNFKNEIATLSYSSEIVIGKNKLPDLLQLIELNQYRFDDINKRYVFPIKLEKGATNYYLQYWTENFNGLLNVFVDSTEDIESVTKQYLCKHATRYNASNHAININENIINSLTDNTLYLSVSLENETRLNMYNFLLKKTYKFQLEKDVYTEYEAYKESVKHHPMYLTAGGLTLESTSSYCGIRKLEPPKNIVSKYNNGLTNITWDKVVGASSYILYLDGKAKHTVETNAYETMAEMQGILTIRAQNSVAISEFSEGVLIHSVPTNPYIIYIDNKYEDNEYKFDIHFQDNSYIETGYKVRYKVDEEEEKVIKLDPVDGIGKIIKTNFSTPIVQDQVIVRMTAMNDQGENAVASQFNLKVMPEFVWTYDEHNGKIKMAWENKFKETECSHYVVRYKKKSEDTTTTVKLPNDYGDNLRIQYAIDLAPEDEMELSLSAFKNDIYYVFTKPKKVSKKLDTTKISPSNFISRKIENHIVEFSWTDNSLLETGWELAYSVNNGSPKTIKINSTSTPTNNQTYTHQYTFQDHGFMTAKLRTVWELGVSDFTKEITNYYYPIDKNPPQGLKKQYQDRTSMLITWEPQSYFETYEVVITKKDKTETIKTKDNSYIINLNDKVIEEYKVKVRTNFLGDQQSNYTDEITFTPTISDNQVLTTINTKCREEYVDIRKKTNEVRDDYDVVTRSTSKVSWSFPLVTATLSIFQTYEGLISTETWNTGQRTEYVDIMSVKTVEAKMQEAVINTLSYQKTEYAGHLQAFVYTPCSISGKIVMEINKTRIVCIGDSITAGHPGFWAESMTGEITHQYPYWLDRRLKFQYEVINKGYGSDRTFNVLARFQKDVLDLSPQYCLMQIGTNDIYWGGASADGSIEAFDSTTLADMKKNVETMVDLCFRNNIVPIIGMLIPRTQVVTDPVVKHGLYAFNDWIVKYANETEGLNYVDFFNAGKDKIPATPLEDPKSPGAMNPIYDGDNVYDEMGNLVKYGAGIHLNAAGYRIMAEAIPLNLFTTIQSGVKMYMDEKCTIEAEYNIEDKQNPFYEIEIEGMKLTRTKKIVRYIKNIGNTQVLFSIYPNDLYNLDYNFKFKDTDKGTKSISGILSPGSSKAIKMELTPLTEDSKSSIELSLVSREFSIETK